jgi:uncharacterized protein (TIGR02271 family)
MIDESQLSAVEQATVYGNDGERIGKVGQVYLDDETGRPEWVSVNTGLFGLNESLVPLRDASVTGDRVDVAYDKEMVKGAPRVSADGHLEPNEEDELYRYYGLSYTSAGDYATGDVGTGRDWTAATDTTGAATGTRSTGTADDAMTRSEEELRVGTEKVERGRARLRKSVTTEQQTVTVPVTRDEVRVEREPITDANRDAALDGRDITESEHEVVLQEERPVVATEVRPVERVRLEKETVTDQQQVSGEVRKEHIEFDDESGARR